MIDGWRIWMFPALAVALGLWVNFMWGRMKKDEAGRMFPTTKGLNNVNHLETKYTLYADITFQLVDIKISSSMLNFWKIFRPLIDITLGVFKTPFLRTGRRFVRSENRDGTRSHQLHLSGETGSVRWKIHTTGKFSWPVNLPPCKVPPWQARP